MSSFNRSKCMTIAEKAASFCHNGKFNLLPLMDTIRDELASTDRKAWLSEGEKVLDWLQACHNAQRFIKPVYTVFAKGNSKLPFYSFAALPVVFCPGAGECKSFCYSLKAWRYPAAFFRQLQNSLLLMHGSGRDILADMFNALPANISFRLYTDGDFARTGDIIFWMRTIKRRPDVKAYGYSKSFYNLLDADGITRGKIWPDNYKLNISNGSNATTAIIERVKRLPIVRGNFIAIADKTSTDRQLIAAHKVASGKATFLCPGQCGECTRKVHACGSNRFDNVDIIIRVH